MNEHTKHCKSISEELDEIVNNLAYECKECCNTFSASTDADDVSCPHCQSKEVELCYLERYFEDCLDVQYYVEGNANRPTYRAVRILVTFGGPNIYIDTNRMAVELFWWNEYASYPLKDRTAEAIDALFESWFFC